MTLAAYQRALVELSFAADPPEDPALAPFQLYRHMIRARLFAMAEAAYRRSWALLGAPACAASFTRFLALEPPRSPLIREVIGAFARFAEADRALLTGAPREASDLLRFEAAKWRAASAEARPAAPGALREVDFDGVLVLNPTLERLALDYLVSEPLDERAPREPHTLLVYRRRHDDDVRWYRAPALLAELLALATPGSGARQRSASTAPDEGEATLGELVARLFARRAPDSDQVEPLLGELAAALTVAVERDVLWGVREPGAPG